MCSGCISRLRSLRRELEQISIESWEEVQSWVAKATPIFINDWPAFAAEFRKVTLPPSWERGLSPVGIRLNRSAQSKADSRAACRQEANKILAENKKQEILKLLDGLLAVSSDEEDDESQLLMGTRVEVFPSEEIPPKTRENEVGTGEQMGRIPWVIVNGTLQEVWNCLKRQKQRWEDRQAPVMMTGPFLEADDVNCLIKPVKDVAKRLPDELHFGKLRAIRSSGEQYARVNVFFEQHYFPEPALFGKARSELIEVMRQAGLRPEMPALEQPSSLDHEKPNGKQPDDIATIRGLLLAAFTPEDLRRFCLDRSTFRPIVFTFGPGQGLDDMVDRVIDYCRTRDLWEQFLAQVKVERPKVYARFAADLHLITGTELENWNWRRILLRNDEQYFVHEAKRHHLDPGAGKVCDAYIVDNEKIEEDEARFLWTVPKGDDYNETTMRALLHRIYPERADVAEQVLKDNTPASMVLPVMAGEVDNVAADMGVAAVQRQLGDAENEGEVPQIGIITALPKEFAAMKALLENPCEWHREGRGAGRRYLLGEVPITGGDKHFVVLALAGMGNNSAANRATRLLEHFPKVDSIIMVGIAGGVPHPAKPDEHVRLGDIVVTDEEGVIQYDFVKEETEGIIPRYPPRPPSATLAEGTSFLEVGGFEGKRPWLAFIDQALEQLNWARPPEESDILADPHDPKQIIPHPDDPERVKGQPRIFRGPIASANNLLKNPIKRDELRDRFGVKAVEMEGSGIADATWTHEVGYLVVRGICDYCDSSKGDVWQRYAAVVAAAYARALLESIPPRQTMETIRDHRQSWSPSNATASSAALSCVKKVARATKEIIEASSRGGLRNQYRRHLGVVIDRLDRSFGKVGEFKGDEWPPLVHYTEEGHPQLADRDGNPDIRADRWDFFELHITPVVEQIKGFSFSGKYPQEASLNKEIHQLEALTNLCNQLENVVSDLDAAFEVGKVKLDKTGDSVIVRPMEFAAEGLNNLRKSYADLHAAWQKWLHAVDMT